MTFTSPMVALILVSFTNGLSARAAVVGPQSDNSKVKILKSTLQTSKNTDCKKNDTCDLKEFSLITQDYSVDLTAQGLALSYGTRMYASYRTDKIEKLGKYGIGQFIRGCMFDSRMENGELKKSVRYSREYYGKTMLYHHPEKAIDGIVRDPLDWGWESVPNQRHAYYQWNPKPELYDVKGSKYVIEADPTLPTLFVSDRPGTVFYDANAKTAKNISLEFSTCIYKTKEVPTDVAPDKLDFAEPIQCFSWTSSFVYNHRKGKFETLKTLDSICTDKNPSQINLTAE